MERLMQMHVQVTEPVYLKDPAATDLGRRIIEHGIRLIDELGLERFTFGKLASALGTAESSIYRYFDNKHRLLIYLVGWYWSWRELKLVFDTANIADAKERLERGIRSVTEPVKEKGSFAQVDLRALYRIAIAESAKAYMTKEVDEEHRQGCFGSFGRLSGRLHELILAACPRHPYPALLASTIIDGSSSQRFFADHLPTLTDSTGKDPIPDHFVHLAFASIAQATKRP